MNEHLLLLVRLETREASPNEAVTWALQRVADDKATDSINELAWLNEPSRTDVLSLFRKALVELGIGLPDNKELKLIMAKHIARGIVEGRVDPNTGCTMIGDINHELDWPQELAALGLLSHEQTGHENLGITSQNIRPSILEEARKLANAT